MNRRLIIVDDRKIQLAALEKEIADRWPDWEVLIRETAAEAIDLVDDLMAHGRFPHLVLVDLGLKPNNECPEEGLKLLRYFREKHSGLRLAVHSSLDVTQEVLHEVLTMGVSYIRVNDLRLSEEYGAILSLLAGGYIVFSPTAAPLIPAVLAQRPDPLDKQQWNLLADLASADHPTYQVMAARRGYQKPDSVQEKLSDVARLLAQEKLISLPQTPKNKRSGVYRERLIEFYKRYHVCYRR